MALEVGCLLPVAVYDMHENLLQSAEDGLTTCAVFCDLSKAFDTTDHDILLWKLGTFYGIRAVVLNLFSIAPPFSNFRLFHAP